MPQRPTGEWYVWAGEYLKDAMKGWGLATILILLPTVLLTHICYHYGGSYLNASILKMQKEAEAATAVARAVTDLTCLARDAQQFQESAAIERAQIMKAQTDILNIMLLAKTEMADSVKHREEHLKLLQQIRNAVEDGS